MRIYFVVVDFVVLGYVDKDLFLVSVGNFIELLGFGEFGVC